MAAFKFDANKIARLDDPGRLDDLRPEAMWDALGSPTPESIADIGAGTGMFSEQFARLAPETTIFAIDTDQRMLDWISDKRAALVDAGRIVPVLSEESVLPLPDGSVDLATLINMHHELEDVRAMYAEVTRILRPGGQALVVDWADRDTPHGPPMAARSSASEIGKVLADAGLEAVAIHDVLPYHSLVTARKPR